MDINKYITTYSLLDANGIRFSRVVPKTPDDSIESSLETDLKARLAQIQRNIKALGSIQGIISNGGDQAKRYLNNTGQMIFLYLFVSEILCLSLKEEDLQKASTMAKKSGIKTLLESPWEALEAKSEELRSEFVNSLTLSSLRSFTKTA